MKSPEFKLLALHMDQFNESINAFIESMKCCGNCTKWSNGCTLNMQKEYRQETPFRRCTLWEHDRLKSEERMIAE